MSRLIYNYGLDGRRTARIPASSRAEADEEGREGLAELVRAILRDETGETITN